MICCVDCFKDSEIIAIITSLNIRGSCEVCLHEDTYIYDIDRNDNLISYFNELIDIYTPISKMSEEMKEYRAEFSLLKDELNSRWNLFNVGSPKVYKIITEICKKRYEQTPEIFDEPIGIVQMYDKEFKEKNSILRNYNWQGFTEEIKNQNRFHIKSFNSEVFARIIEYASTTFRRGEMFYRARLSNQRATPFPQKCMGAPPKGKASSGRVNPLGISCLYLASGLETAIKEIRAGIHDNVSIAKFELLKDIEVIDLTQLDKFSPLLGYDHVSHAINKEYLTHISNEVGTPLKGNDPNIGYLPSQYICDLIKSEGKKGVKYQSTMDKEEFNLAVFNEEYLRCTEVALYEVTEIKYNFFSKR
ncbi:RES family NAD+ phosphorylase [Bacillus sp. FJAT-49711]|uniref:RES family NAD+ phosphorylase n=1 Tax=Bacillus sp. FJAT-49711 TaxID=2833585 RepID=UPI001BC9F210|nr:RES family NAD+ phosphorylase [Bacillus sp. FJAT-49711]MBS4219046.1 RES family NAD+ phosphorylase [Bacillus sp. FJAT-49711]